MHDATCIRFNIVPKRGGFNLSLNITALSANRIVENTICPYYAVFSDFRRTINEYKWLNSGPRTDNDRTSCAIDNHISNNADILSEPHRTQKLSVWANINIFSKHNFFAHEDGRFSSWSTNIHGNVFGVKMCQCF